MLRLEFFWMVILTLEPSWLFLSSLFKCMSSQYTHPLLLDAQKSTLLAFLLNIERRKVTTVWVSFLPFLSVDQILLSRKLRYTWYLRKVCGLGLSISNFQSSYSFQSLAKIFIGEGASTIKDPLFIIYNKYLFFNTNILVLLHCFFNLPLMNLF